MANQPTRKTKRLVKNPETFRERASKATEAAGKQNQPTRLKQATGNVTSPMAGAFQATGGRLARLKPFRLIGKIIFPAYFRNSWQELRLVTWPNWAESRRLTFAVLIFAVLFGAIIAGVDYGLDKIFKNILLK